MEFSIDHQTAARQATSIGVTNDNRRTHAQGSTDLSDPFIDRDEQLFPSSGPANDSYNPHEQDEYSPVDEPDVREDPNSPRTVVRKMRELGMKPDPDILALAKAGT
jgi:hypothetical protein